MTVLPGGDRLLRLHARELPQRDDLCGAFCAALALQTAGIEECAGEPVDQDAVALAAGTIVSALSNPDILPLGEQGRRDYRVSLPTVEDSTVSGTTAAGLVYAIEKLSEGQLAAIPYGGPWTSGTLAGIFDVAASLSRPVALLANFATRYLCGARPRVDQLLDYLLGSAEDGPEPDWDVGHFACVVGRIRGPGASLYCVADTYPSLGGGGIHLQPEEHLARAIERREMPAGGIIVVASAEDAPSVRSGAAAVGLLESLWDNGTPAAEMLS